MTENFWLINSNRSRVKRFSKNNQNKDKFFEYIFIDSGRILGVLGKEPPNLPTLAEKIKANIQVRKNNIIGGQNRPPSLSASSML